MRGRTVPTKVQDSSVPGSCTFPCSWPRIWLRLTSRQTSNMRTFEFPPVCTPGQSTLHRHPQSLAPGRPARPVHRAHFEQWTRRSGSNEGLKIFKRIAITILGGGRVDGGGLGRTCCDCGQALEEKKKETLDGRWGNTQNARRKDTESLGTGPLVKYAVGSVVHTVVEDR